ncbi:MAG: helix-turn-helix domain-containing protein [Pseudonocardiaceae bacterium]|nr:helix-turn-helix domain-containing protein [Pseudonocardiaceae bacterium]
MNPRGHSDGRGLWTPRQLAEFLGPPISVKTIYDWNYRGVGPKYCRIGRHIRFRPADVEAWLQQHEIDNG